MNFADVMSALAAAVVDAEIEGIGERAFGWPIGECPVPCFVVGYPEGDMNLNLTCGPRADGALVRGNFQAWWIVGAATARTTPEDLGSKIEAIKEAIDGDLGGAAETALVMTASIQPISVSGGEYLAVRFLIDVVS